MNSAERHEARYQRRRKKRLARKKEIASQIGGYDDVFSYFNLYKSCDQCKDGVRWKASVQKYEATQSISTLSVFNTMTFRRFKSKGFDEFDIIERGKPRHIKALYYSERVIQRCLCDNYLEKVLYPQLIYDNGASVKGKGTEFSINRLIEHLHRFYRRNGLTGFILQYDFHDFFNSIDHNTLYQVIQKFIYDGEIYKILKDMIDIFGDVGLGLGSQVSQLCAVFFLTPLDKFFKEKMHIKEYGRYMDDGYMLCKTIEEVNKCKEMLLYIAKRMKLSINEKKFKVTKMGNTFVFLKKRFRVTDTGKVYVKMGKEAITRNKRKAKKLIPKILDESENITYNDVKNSVKSFIGSNKHYSSYKTLRNFKGMVKYELYKNNLQWTWVDNTTRKGKKKLKENKKVIYYPQTYIKTDLKAA